MRCKVRKEEETEGAHSAWQNHLEIRQTTELQYCSYCHQQKKTFFSLQEGNESLMGVLKK
jgi:hypothetical protein